MGTDSKGKTVDTKVVAEVVDSQEAEEGEVVVGEVPPRIDLRDNRWRSSHTRLT